MSHKKEIYFHLLSNSPPLICIRYPKAAIILMQSAFSATLKLPWDVVVSQDAGLGPPYTAVLGLQTFWFSNKDKRYHDLQKRATCVAILKLRRITNYYFFRKMIGLLINKVHTYYE